MSPTGEIYCKDQCTSKEEQQGLLTTVFKDGKLVKRTNLEQIREKTQWKSILMTQNAIWLTSY